jgi:hypothetical protein
MQSFKSYIKDIRPGCRVRNCNPDCEHFGSTGVVVSLKKLEDPENAENIIGDEVEYKCDCGGKTWKPNQILRKTKDQLEVI